MPTILLSGFEPFAAQPTNPSQQIIETLAADPQQFLLGDIMLETVILSVIDQQAEEHLIGAVDTFQPDAVICLGETSRPAIACESLFINQKNYRIADNAGQVIADSPVIEDGPADYATTLPTDAIQQAIIATGIAAEVSANAGTFLCNQVAYALLHAVTVDDRSTIPAGFIHVPRFDSEEDLQTYCNAIATAITIVACECNT